MDQLTLRCRFRRIFSFFSWLRDASSCISCSVLMSWAKCNELKVVMMLRHSNVLRTLCGRQHWLDIHQNCLLVFTPDILPASVRHRTLVHTGCMQQHS